MIGVTQNRNGDDSVMSDVDLTNLHSFSSVTSTSTVQDQLFSKSEDELLFSQNKRIKLKDLSCGGTLIENSSHVLNYIYDAANELENPCITEFHDKKKDHSVTLLLAPDSKEVLISDLNAQLRSSIYENSTDLSMGRIRKVETSATATISGKVVINVENSWYPLLIKSFKVKLCCYTTEMVNYIDKDQKIYRPLNGDLDDLSNCKERTSFAYLNKYCSENPINMLPLQQISIDLIKVGEADCTKLLLLSKGKYAFPFTINIRPNEFPADLNTMFGKTCYRVESLISLHNIEKKGADREDQIILTEKINFSRVLPMMEINMRYEPSSVMGAWDRAQLFYEISLSTRIFEINRKFNLSFEYYTLVPNFHVKKMAISLIQYVTIPSVVVNDTPDYYFFDYSTKLTKTIRYVYKLREFKMEEKNGVGYNEETGEKIKAPKLCEIQDLVISNFIDEEKRLKNSISPFYFEESSINKGMARIKVTHKLTVTLTIEKNGGKNETVLLIIKIPVLLVGPGMLENLTLPKYEPFQSLHDISNNQAPPYSHGTTNNM
ncbi:hypothetical protein KAFR_0G03640 [Kazachstania africana CBS 2517]|uniref:Arrestin C-terminal-like domain-containing protein n=1 Tax=Kazachstania africana (strain ATCC 22294 / BCRC 22015 / CBS 2517 / CECT 1963 / NBRC 1671 / NRRL Y-8276) TaxID=1071382 RepID=H2AYE6_KAZAF|nr:hypothetical protein KAFR_0G03640 [Kazachstania africana CBS 2517]CCF59396.1 hypothetical protein KAFR_0G03640 [Kazachstania africana CBS 2517]